MWYNIWTRMPSWKKLYTCLTYVKKQCSIPKNSCWCQNWCLINKHSLWCSTCFLFVFGHLHLENQEFCWWCWIVKGSTKQFLKVYAKAVFFDVIQRHWCLMLFYWFSNLFSYDVTSHVCQLWSFLVLFTFSPWGHLVAKFGKCPISWFCSTTKTTQKLLLCFWVSKLRIMMHITNFPVEHYDLGLWPLHQFLL